MLVWDLYYYIVCIIVTSLLVISVLAHLCPHADVQEVSADIYLKCLSVWVYILKTSHVQVGKKAWYTDAPPKVSDISHAEAAALIPVDTTIWVGRVRG